MTISTNKVVLMHYTLKNDQGEVLDTSENREPLAFIQGMGNIIPGLETKLEGKTAGDKLDATVKPEDGYGEHVSENIHKVPKSNFDSEDGEELQVGMQVQVQSNQGIALALVAEIEEEEVTLDMNHPLAGETLHFNVEIVDVRDATADEINHGHAHGPGGHHH
jgi:FKBP-type peptidyl-prolyl cis-trans isomerase SlyD